MVLVVILGVWLLNRQTESSNDDAEKYACEVAYGAGNCVKSGGEWVPIGSSPSG